MFNSATIAAFLANVKASVYQTKQENRHFDAESPVDELTDFFMEISSLIGYEISDSFCSEVEGLVALFFALQGCSTATSFAATIFLYVRKYCSKSIVAQVLNYVRQTLNLPQSGEKDGCETSTPDWLRIMQDARDNWELCRNNKLFSHFSKLLGLLVSLELCKISDVTFSVKNYVIFEPDLKVVHGNALDIADAAFSTVTFFVENMHEAFRTNSLRCFVTGDKVALELDEEFSRMCLWWDLVRNGNLQKIAGVADSEFDDRLEKLTTKIRHTMNGKAPFEKKLLGDKLTRLLSIKNDYITMKISSGVRKSPFAVQLFGKSSQGKTVYGDQIVDALLTSAALPLSKEFRASYNPGDKFMSNWTTNKEVMIIDDFANEKSNFVERPPTRVIVDVCNNQPFYANMADLASKGKVFVEPSIVVVNTNVKDLDAYVYSNCPYSIQRRMHAVITVEAKPEFQLVVDGRPQGLDSRKVREFYKDLDTVPLFDDIWNLTVERAIEPPDLTSVATYAPIPYRGKLLKNVGFSTVLQFLIDEFEAHRLNQDFILTTVKNRNQDVELCEAEGCCHIKGYCPNHFQPHSGFDFEKEIASAIDTSIDMVTDRVKNDYFSAQRALAGVSTFALLSATKYFVDKLDWIAFVPTRWIMDHRLQTALMALDYKQIKRKYFVSTLVNFSVLLLFLFVVFFNQIDFGNCTSFVVIMSVVACIWRQATMANCVQLRYRQELVRRNNISPLLKEYRDRCVKHVCGASAIIGTLYLVAKIYKRWNSMKKQGSLEPKTIAEVVERDSEESPWTQVARRQVPLNSTMLSTTPDELSNNVQKNLVYGTILAGDRKLQANCLFLTSNVLVIPSHYFETDVIECTFRKANPDACGGKFTCKLDLQSSVRIKDTDLCVCYAHSGGSFKDLTRWLPDVNLVDHQFSMFWRNIDGSLVRANGLSKSCLTSNGVCDFLGGEYRSLSIDTRPGLCGAVLVSHGRGTCISGFHLGGMTGTPLGCYGVLTKPQVKMALTILKERPGVVLSGSAEHFEKQAFGVTLLRENEGLHTKSPLRYMPNDSQIEYYGTCDNCVSSHTDARVTPISDAVTTVTGEPNVYCGPKMKPEWYGWQACLANMANPAKPFDYTSLAWAINDYKRDLIPIFASPLWCNASPLSYHDTICGIRGVKFMDPIKLDTSMGFPLTGVKRRYVVELDPTEEHPNLREFVPEVNMEIERCESCYKRGERAYTIAKACKKDEILSKEKCRIFFSNPVALTFLIRKYYLPLLRVLQMNPLVSECAVGINSHGPEWDSFYSHTTTFGVDRILGGDYGKYDQKLSSQLIFAALRVLIDLAKECNYSEEDISVMHAMAGDIVYSYINFNGDLIGLTEGSHISGNSLTVIINGICGSLNLRVAFRELVEESDTLSFRNCVKLMTYGDDNIGSVSRLIDGFSIKTISKFLEKYGQTYTMPDKESELCDFLDLEQFEFLKRKSVYCPDKGCHVGALVDKSIFKMLHMYLRPKGCDISEEWACALNIDTALREWFNHGREVYEYRRHQMQIIARTAQIEHLCTQLDLDYDSSLVMWIRRYEPWRLSTAAEI